MAGMSGAELPARLQRLSEELPALRALVAADPGRSERLQCEAAGLRWVYGHQRVDEAVLAALAAFADTQGLPAAIERLFAGERVNATEDRAALHMALRAPPDTVMTVDGQNVVPEVQTVLESMARFATAVREGLWRGHTGEPIRYVVNIGIGGSDLGPRMVCEALQDFADGPRLRFVANVDPADLEGVLRFCQPAQTLFIVTSKTFGTLETLANARAALAWLQRALPGADPARHFVAVTTNLAAAGAFGIPPAQCFGFWDWVGGRYSVWSAVGLAIMVALGPDRFQAFRSGAWALDVHFRTAPLRHNLPVLMGLIAYWNQQYLGVASQVVSPYAQRLSLFVPWLQQLEMESNGKGVHRDGQRLSGHSTPPLWGDIGSNAQHAFFQMLHQGTRIHAVDFIVPLQPTVGDPDRHRMLVANALAQSAALMWGRPSAEVEAALVAEGLDADAVRAAAPHRVFPGNRPSSLLLLERIDPPTLGALMALYEHRTYVLSVLWDIHPFDQWGVELGKQIARRVDAALAGGTTEGLDPSTAALVRQLVPRFTTD